jgi:uncharacterized protein YgbK (DUF1537 family)
MDRFVITADDRTGALEVAGALAERLGRTVHAVPSGSDGPDRPDGAAADRRVVDLGSRSLPPVAAAAAAGRFGRLATAHKIDSTLRGRWADEVAAFVASGRRRALVVPALPSLGRVCIGGVVSIDGVPVADGPAGSDPRHPVRSSRPADHLHAAGLAEVTDVADERQLTAWLDHGLGVAVCDAASVADLDRVGAAWRASSNSPLFVGTAGSIAAAIAPAVRARPLPVPPVSGVLVACGSLHPVARRQVGVLVRSSDPLDQVAVALSSRVSVGAAVDDAAAVAAATELAARVDAALATRSQRALLVVGGDTAAALLGDAVVEVHGTLAAGTPWGIGTVTRRLVATRSGGFGDDAALVDMVAALLHGRL